MCAFVSMWQVFAIEIQHASADKKKVGNLHSTIMYDYNIYILYMLNKII